MQTSCWLCASLRRFLSCSSRIHSSHCITHNSSEDQPCVLVLKQTKSILCINIWSNQTICWLLTGCVIFAGNISWPSGSDLLPSKRSGDKKSVLVIQTKIILSGETISVTFIIRFIIQSQSERREILRGCKWNVHVSLKSSKHIKFTRSVLTINGFKMEFSFAYRKDFKIIFIITKSLFPQKRVSSYVN